MMCSLGFSQGISRDLKLAVKESGVVVRDTLVKLNPDLGYYSRNYDKVFPIAHYTFDTMEYGSRVIHIGDRNGSFYDRDTPHIFRVMPMAGVNVDASQAQPIVPGYSSTE